MNKHQVFNNRVAEKETSDDEDETAAAAAPTKESRSRFGLIFEDQPPASPHPTQRRSIFDTFWKRSPSSNSWKEERIEEEVDDDDGSSEARCDVKRSPKLKPSYLGIYYFSPTPPLLSSSSSSKCLSQSPKQHPESILRRQHSPRVVSEPDRSSMIMYGGGGSKSDFARIASLPISGDTSEESMSQTDSEPRKPSHVSVHFDPTITVREVMDEDLVEDSNWFSESELKSFMSEAINLCYSSAYHGLRTYSLPALTKAITAAHKAGVDNPVMSQTRDNECHSLFFDPILQTSDDDAVVHDCSDDFFTIISNEVKSILIVDNSITALKLFKRHLLSMFPEAQIHVAQSGEDALKLFEEHCDSAEEHYFDIIIVEHNMQSCVPRVPMLADQNEASNVSGGSELLSIINFIERNRRRRSLKIGVSVNLAEDVEAMHRSGADLFWCKPPPKQTKSLRNEILNHLLSKRGKNIFICDC